MTKKEIMSVIKLLSSSLGVNNDIPNQKLAEEIAASNNSQAIKELAETLEIPIITFGRLPGYTLTPFHIQSDLSGISGMISTPRGDFPFKSQLPGNHNLENILAAAGVGTCLALPLEVPPPRSAAHHAL